MIYTAENVRYGAAMRPVMHDAKYPDDISDATFRAHLKRVLDAMRGRGYDALAVYADREHGGCFNYICGFEPRFEEAVLVLRADGKAAVMLGNENLKMANYARLPLDVVHMPRFSLPNQPMTGDCSMGEAFARAGIARDMRCGVAGWKMFTTSGDNRNIFDVPAFILDGIREAAGTVENAADIFLSPDYGVRATAFADEIARFEYAATEASHRVMRVIEQLKPGVTERELAENLSAYGMPLSVYSMCACGERFTNGVVYPRSKPVVEGEKFTVSMGLRGGLTCRAGYAAYGPDADTAQWLERVVKPYFAASATWYSSISVGATGGEVYAAVETSFPKAQYGWKLNPGHLLAEEEWLSSPFMEGSEIKLRSGMILQMDIIPSVPGFAGTNAEDGVLLADAQLRAELAEDYPEMYGRMCARRDYMRNVLGIAVSDDVLPMSDSAGYLPPFMMAGDKCLAIETP